MGIFQNARNWLAGERPAARPVERSDPDELIERRPQNRIRARYDAAQTTDENARHWQWADLFSADAAMIPGVRQTLRKRARYEVANNSYAKGIVLTIANDTIGTGPRLQMSGPNSTEVEDAWDSWSSVIRLGRKLRTRVMARITDGEAVGIMSTNPRCPHPVKLDLRLVEADQLADPWIPWLTPNKVDGIEFDDFHDPVEYHILKCHPGGLYPTMTMDFDKVPARFVCHLYRMDRPQQSRGVPEIAPALELFAKLRRFTDAVIAAAESAANINLVLETEAPADEGADLMRPFSTIDMERGMLTILPAGNKLNQSRAEQPTSTYEMFKKEILNEIARCLNIPYNVAACNSSGYNYSSGRLDHQVYWKSLTVDRGEIERTDVEPIFREWFQEAARVYGWSFGIEPHAWRWDRQADVDPDTEAKARMQRLGYGSSLVTEFSEIGRDAEQELASAAKILGVSLEEYQTLLRQKIFGYPMQQQQQPNPAAAAEEK